MKKKIFSGIAVLALVTMIGINVKMSQQKNKLGDLSLANVEALAAEDDDGKLYDDCHLHNYGSTGQTKSCKLDIGGGLFTASVKRVCVTTSDASKTCTEVDCGGVF